MAERVLWRTYKQKPKKIQTTKGWVDFDTINRPYGIMGWGYENPETGQKHVIKLEWGEWNDYEILEPVKPMPKQPKPASSAPLNTGSKENSEDDSSIGFIIILIIIALVLIAIVNFVQAYAKTICFWGVIILTIVNTSFILFLNYKIAFMLLEIFSMSDVKFVDRKIEENELDEIEPLLEQRKKNRLIGIGITAGVLVFLSIAIQMYIALLPLALTGIGCVVFYFLLNKDEKKQIEGEEGDSHNENNVEKLLQKEEEELSEAEEKVELFEEIEEEKKNA